MSAPRFNIVLFLSDDQPAAEDTELGLAYMPRTNAVLRQRGALLTHHMVTTPVCAPARAALLSGRYPHNTGCFANDFEHGAYSWWQPHEERTVAVALQEAGYDTLLLGKYMNGYGGHAERIPPGWSHWRGFTGCVYYGPQVSEQGNITQYGDDVYSTDLIRDGALHFLRNRSSHREPFFMYLSYTAAHWPMLNPRLHDVLWQPFQLQQWLGCQQQK